MSKYKKLPVGIENFEEICTEGFYYVDKTRLIKELLHNWGKVNLFTRPRRFGKSLTMSMLKYFFEYGCDSRLFNGLEISGEKDLCEKYMGNYPVISISLKNVTGTTFEAAKGMLRRITGQEALRFSFLEQSDKLTEIERKQYKALTKVNEEGLFIMTDETLSCSLLTLSQLLQKHYEQNVIILIDEYDVPLDKAYQSGYYDNMTGLIKDLFGQALKTNDSLYFAVLTGCLRISKESIFTGLNNFNVYTIKDVQYNKYFGFTDREVRQMLAYYGWDTKYTIIKEWYDGYRFGNVEIYCPWDVISFCHALKMNPSAKPQNYWVNTSSNDIIRKFISKAKTNTRNEIEQLIDGKSIKKRIREELTYRDLNSDIDNLWSLLFTTGYLTWRGEKHMEEDSDTTELVIPNREIRWIFVEQIRRWFHEEAAKDSKKLEYFCKAFQKNDVAAIEDGLQAYLKKTISIRDANAKKDLKENFYHGILLGLFSHMDGWNITSNAEAGDGYSDITIEVEEEEIGIIIELKYAENAQFDTACDRAIKQIKDKKYEEKLLDDGMKTIYRYGIACYKKRCKVVSM